MNPGRAQLLNKADVQVAAEMWLGLAFWQQAPCTKEEVFASDLFIEKKDTPHYLYLKAWPEPFTRPDGEQGRVQHKLWRLLFHQNCEWPTGSGASQTRPWTVRQNSCQNDAASRDLALLEGGLREQTVVFLDARSPSLLHAVRLC